MEHQDWTPVVIDRRRSAARSAEAKEAAVQKALRDGTAVAVKKQGAGHNPTHGSGAGNMRKLDEETEEFVHAHVGHDFAQALQKARTAAGLKQKDLAQRINEKATIINEYESGRAIPNHGIIQKLEKALNCRLPRPPKPQRAAAGAE